MANTGKVKQSSVRLWMCSLKAHLPEIYNALELKT